MVALANLPAGQSSQEFEDAWKNFPGIAHSGDGTGVGTEEMVGVEDGDKVGDGVGSKPGLDVVPCVVKDQGRLGPT